MNPILQQEEEIFEVARHIGDRAAREEFLAQACNGNAALRAGLDELLAAAGAAEEFFADGSSAVQMLGAELRRWTPPETDPDRIDEHVGTRIGNYKLLEKIGEGGCGVVYMAEQERPVRRRVALKIIKLGMDTKSVIARFEAERQALALMDHPNIARVLDAGATEAGRPYFVMELVRGFKITEYCDANNLATRARLDLFVLVCHAIQHAHQKGIIHRDVKPSNILVTLHDGVPVPKVIDFGIAKATEARLTDKTLFTAYAQIIGTPAYMSPEQAEMSGLDVDTRADIYSLGVLLYELLTGRPPFDPKQLLAAGFDEMRRTLREREPQKPSTILTTLQNEELTTTAKHRHVEALKLISQLRGDLDWIVMKALEKDRKRRYETANGLAMDIQRYLANEPVVARPPSRLYRLRKLVRRNQAVFSATVAVVATLLAGFGVSTWLFFRERTARRRAVAAEQQQARLREDAERGLANEAELRRQAEMRDKIRQAAAWVDHGRFAEADKLLAEIPTSQSTLEGAAVYRSVGEWNALQGDWKNAASRLTMMLRVGQVETWDNSTLDYTRAAAALLEHGDRAGYEQFRREASRRFATTTDAVVAERTVKNCLLLPADEALLTALTPLLRLAEKSLTDGNQPPTDEEWMAPWRCVSVALAEYRLGDHSEAIRWCERSMRYGEDNSARAATTRVIRAMAMQQLNKIREARLDLTQAQMQFADHFSNGMGMGSGGPGFWFDWVLGRILLREAEELVGEELHSKQGSAAP